MNRLSVLHIAKWYPNKFDIQNGVFVQKHIHAISLESNSMVLFFKEDPSLKTPFEIVESQDSGFKTQIIYHQPISTRKTIAFKLKVLKDILYSTGFKPDVIHLHILSADQLIFSNYAEKNKIPLFISEHWSGYIDGRFEKLPFLKKLIYKKMTKNAAGIFPVSSFLKKGMQKSGLKGQYLIIPNVVQVIDLIQEPVSSFTFLMVTDLDDANKNISGVMRAFHQFSSREISLKIVGDGPDRIALHHLHSELKDDRIKFLGRKDNHSALLEMAKANCLVVNSYIETFSVVCLEARGMGLQVVATKCGGPEEILDEDAIWVNPGNNESLKTAMLTALEINSSKKMDITNYSPQFIVKKIREQYLMALV